MQAGTPPLHVVEIVRRLEQGVTRPFLVRTEDDVFYVAKGRNLPPRERMAEWLAASLAQAAGLPIPDFTLLDVPQELIDLYGADGNELGSGLVFGSRLEASAQEFSVSDLAAVPAQLARKAFAFDWWICNADRSLTERGGNPNLLWLPTEKRVVLIDHNLAFDLHFNAGQFLEVHAFRQRAPEVFDDLVNKAEIALALDAALTGFDAAVAAIPAAWGYLDVECTLPAGVEWVTVKARLAERVSLSPDWL